jgi:serine/threonine protein kinase
MLYGLATGVAETLVAIHAAGIVHRDLKPSNVLLTAAGPKVIDFGIAQALDATVLTSTGMTVGSPGFMAPEQILGQAGQPADIFAWGVTIAYAATGQSPFGVGPTDAILYRVLHESADVSGVSPEIRPLVEKALSKDPAARPSASELLRQLAIGSDPGPDPALDPTQAVLARTWLDPAGKLLPGAAGTTVRPWRPGRRFLTAVIGVAAVAVLAGAGLGLLARPPAKQAPASGATRPPPQSQSSATQASPLASPSQSAPAASGTPTAQMLGGIARGTQNCGFNTEDGTELASVSVTNTVCRDVAAALAADGHYWWPVDYQSPTTAYQNGGTGMSRACSMTANGMTLAVYDMPTNAPTQTLNGVATSVCQKEEAAGWLPS